MLISFNADCVRCAASSVWTLFERKTFIMNADMIDVIAGRSTVGPTLIHPSHRFKHTIAFIISHARFYSVFNFEVLSCPFRHYFSFPSSFLNKHTSLIITVNRLESIKHQKTITKRQSTTKSNERANNRCRRRRLRLGLVRFLHYAFLCDGA